MQKNARLMFRNSYYSIRQKQRLNERGEIKVVKLLGRQQRRGRKKERRYLKRERRGNQKLLPRRAGRTK